MKLQRTLLSFISSICMCVLLNAQQIDTIPQTTKYGLRLGIDIAKPIRTALEDGYTGFELQGDFRFSEKFYAAAELGNEKKDHLEANINATTSGSYIKLGVDYNAHNNWLGLNNAIFTGIRYGFSTFKQELQEYSIYTNDQTQPPSIRIVNEEFNGLSAHWAELIVGIKTEVLNNLYLSINVQLKRKISDKKPNNFDNLYIPGFNSTNDFSEFGAGYGYTISYLIPLFKK